MNKYQEGINLVNEGKLDDAYNYFLNLSNKNPKDESALYLKIQVMEFKGMDQKIILNEYLKLVKIMKKLNNDIYYHISVIYHNFENYDEAIRYAKMGLVNEDEFSTRCRYSLALAYYCKGDRESVKNSLEHITKCISVSDDNQELEFFYSLKVDALCNLELFDDANQLINDFYFKTGDADAAKKLEARILIQRDSITQNKDQNYQNDYLKEAKKVLEAYLNLKPDDYDGWKQLYNVDLDLKEYLDASKILEKLEKDNEIEFSHLINEKFYLASKIAGASGLKNEYDDLSKRYQDTYLIPYYMGYHRFEIAETKEDYEEVVKYANEAYRLKPNEDSLWLLATSQQILKKYQESVELIENYLKNHEESGNLYHMLANAYHKANYSYNQVYQTEKKAYELGCFDYLNFIFNTDGIDARPDILTVLFTKISNKMLPNLSQFHTRKMLIKFAYGLTYPRIDRKKALELIEKQENEQVALSCLYGLTGRMYELIDHDDKKAFDFYQKAYDIFLEDVNIDKCNCAIAYLAHAYLKGIGTTKDETKAIKMITDAIEEYQDDANSNVIYLYAYLFLTDRIEADYHKVLHLLRLNKAFNRYEISREVLISQVCKKVGIKNEYMVEGVKKAKKYDSILANKYHKKAIKEEYYYPFLNSY